MHDPERQALSSAALVLFAVSLLRWAVAARSAPPAPATTADVLTDHLAATAAAVDEEDLRSRPLGQGERLDPNRATAAELDRLPGVGPATARAIVEARDTGATFLTAEDLLGVRGIGPATLAKLRPLLRLSAARAPPAPGGPGRRGVETRRGASDRPAAGRTDRPGDTHRAPVDLNRADAEGLERLPGIGPALARRIIEERTVRPFAALEDLERVRGVGPATVERLRGLATVGGRR
jgi:competence ComEA-like helix-hairpin-helix protein